MESTMRKVSQYENTKKNDQIIGFIVQGTIVVAAVVSFIMFF